MRRQPHASAQPRRRGQRPLLRPAAPLCAALLVLASAVPLAAQAIQGVVVDDASGARLGGVALVLLDSAGEPRAETLADDSGAFRIRAPTPGSYSVQATLIGYGDILSAPITLDPGDDVSVEVRMAVAAVPLEPLVVRGRENRLDPQLAGFYERMERGRRSGLGYFVDREQIDRLMPLQSTDLLRMAPGVRVVRGRQGYGAGLRMSGGCIPAIYVDGVQVNRYPLGNTSLDDIVSGVSVEGIEVYRGTMAQVGSYYDAGGCGLILVWTRRGTETDQPWSWRKLLVGLGLIAALILLTH